jgi:lipopolysaccharide heptosyltransferase II
MNRPPENILVVRTDRLGDLILSTPVITNLRKNFPQSRIAFLCRPYTKGVLENNPYLDEIIVYDKYGIHKGILSTLRFAWSLRKKKFDLAVILHPTNRFHLLTFFAAIPFRIGWNHKLGFLLTKRLDYQKHQGQKHERDYTLDILKALNLNIVTKQLYINSSSSADTRIQEMFKRYKIDRDTKLVALGIGSSCLSKRWPIERFLDIAGCLKKRFKKIKIFILADKTESDLARPFFEQSCPDYLDMVGKLDIPDLISLFKRVNLLLSNDCGLAHVCAGVNTPVIAIFGRNQPGLSPKRWKPLGPYSHYLHQDTGCRDCLAHNCQKGFLCLKAVSVEDVLSLVCKVLQK